MKKNRFERGTRRSSQGGHEAEKDSAMTASVHDLSEKRIEKMRELIDNLFRDINGASFASLRSVAHDALTKLVEGDHGNANIGIDKLGPENARLMREKLVEFGFNLEEKTET